MSFLQHFRPRKLGACLPEAGKREGRLGIDACRTYRLCHLSSLTSAARPADTDLGCVLPGPRPLPWAPPMPCQLPRKTALLQPPPSDSQ